MIKPLLLYADCLQILCWVPLITIKSEQVLLLNCIKTTCDVWLKPNLKWHPSGLVSLHLGSQYSAHWLVIVKNFHSGNEYLHRHTVSAQFLAEAFQSKCCICFRFVSRLIIIWHSDLNYVCFPPIFPLSVALCEFPVKMLNCCMFVFIPPSNKETLCSILVHTGHIDIHTDILAQNYILIWFDFQIHICAKWPLPHTLPYHLDVHF